MDIVASQGGVQPVTPAQQDAAAYSVVQSHLRAQQQAAEDKAIADRMEAQKAAPKTTVWRLDPSTTQTTYGDPRDKEEPEEKAGPGFWSGFSSGASSYQPGRLTQTISSILGQGQLPRGDTSALLLTPSQRQGDTLRTAARYGLGIAAGLVALWGGYKLVKIATRSD
jgi:hypothetical protein